MEQEFIKGRFLVALNKIRPYWANDKQFTKIMRKMENGKNLKKKEFAKIYFLLREIGYY